MSLSAHAYVSLATTVSAIGLACVAASVPAGHDIDLVAGVSVQIPPAWTDITNTYGEPPAGTLIARAWQTDDFVVRVMAVPADDFLHGSNLEDVVRESAANASAMGLDVVSASTYSNSHGDGIEITLQGDGYTSADYAYVVDGVAIMVTSEYEGVGNSISGGQDSVAAAFSSVLPQD